MDLFERKYIYATCKGKPMPLEDMPDEVFSSGMLGVGYAIEPQGKTFYAPISGKIENLADTKHAFTITSDDGVEVLVHIGIDTVELDGNGFKSLVKKDEKVDTGDPVIEIDRKTILEGGYNLTSAVVITNPEIVCDIDYDFAHTVNEESVIISYKNK